MQTMAESTDAGADSGAINRLRLGTNTVRALFINGQAIIALSEGGLYIDPRYLRGLTYVVARDTAYVVGTISAQSVDIVIDSDGIFIAGVGKITGQDLNELLVTIDENARVNIAAN